MRSSSSRDSRILDPRKIYVSNIDFGCTHQEIKEVFSEVGEVAFVEMLKDDNNRPRGCAIVRFKESSHAKEALRSLNRREVKGRNIVVKEVPPDMENKARDTKRRRDDDFEYQHSHNPTFLSPQERIGNTYGLSLQFLESLGIDSGPLISRVFVANVDYNVDEESLKDVFSIAGKVTDVELVKGEDGKSKGFGFIDFEHPLEAVQAISMLHNQLYRDRPLSVQMTKNERKKKEVISPKLPLGLKSIGMGLGPTGAPLKNVAATLAAGNQQGMFGSGLGLDAVGTSMSMASPVTGLLGGHGGGLGLASGQALGGGLSSLRDTSMDVGLGGTSTSLTGRMAPVGMGTTSTFSRFGGSSGQEGLVGNYGGIRNVLQISNLPSDFPWKGLYNLCQPFGDVTFAKLSDIGVGIVHMDSEASARRAVDMLDQQRYEGRLLSVRLM